MAWLEISVSTDSVGIELVAERLTAGGFEDLVLEDQAEFETFLEENRAYCVYFQGATVRNLNFDGITCGKALDAVFGGYGDVEFKARDIFMQDPAVPMLDVADGVKAEIREF